jgi:hypothetical protein
VKRREFIVRLLRFEHSPTFLIFCLCYLATGKAPFRMSKG